MSIRKVIIVDKNVDLAITNICDAALKLDGLPMITAVNAVKESIVIENANPLWPGSTLWDNEKS